MNKAPGTDDIANEVFKCGLFNEQHVALHNSPWLQCITALFNKSLDLGYCPRHFKESTTVALKKPPARDLAAVKSYCSIALLNTLGKLLEAILANRFQYLFATTPILTPTHLGPKGGVLSRCPPHLGRTHLQRLATEPGSGLTVARHLRSLQQCLAPPTAPQPKEERHRGNHPPMDRQLPQRPPEPTSPTGLHSQHGGGGSGHPAGIAALTRFVHHLQRGPRRSTP